MKTTRTISFLQKARRRTAFTMVESMILVAMLGMSAAVVGQSMSTMVTSATTNNLMLQINDQLLSQMEMLRSTYTVPPTSAQVVTTQTVPINGVNYTVTRTVVWDDPGQGTPQPNFVRLQVAIGTQSMSTYVSQ